MDLFQFYKMTSKWKSSLILVVPLCLLSLIVKGQNDPSVEDYLKLKWTHVATEMPGDWYGTKEAKRVAENVLISQKEIGGWAKNKAYHHILSKLEKEEYKNGRSKIGATIDNSSTITEMRFLAKVYSHFPDKRYEESFLKGLEYLFDAQYENGGWPQFYPVRPTSQGIHYSAHITYNDDAMVNVLCLLKDVHADKFPALNLGPAIRQKAKDAWDKGIACIINTQIKVDGEASVWCAQHDAITLAPAKARSYELESFSGSESVGIVMLLMSIEEPSQEIIDAVNGAYNWFQKHKIEGIRVVRETDQEGNRKKRVVNDSKAPPIWARFYDLESEQPYFCDRDGIKKESLADIGSERRNGYSWYTYAPAKLIAAYPDWKKKWK